MVKAFCALAIALLLAACAGAKKTVEPRAAAPEAAAAPSEMPTDQRAEIRRLDDEITASRTTLELPEPTDTDLQNVPTQPMTMAPAMEDPKCRPAQTETCTTSCGLRDSICTNAEKICRIAQELPGDGWAQNMCAKANKTCEAATTKCCGCQ